MIKKISLLFATALLAALGLLFIPKIGAAGANLISNPSVETASGTLPASWSKGKWGSNTATFTYQTSGAHTGSRDLYINMTKHTSGDAKWYFTDVPVKPNTSYTYSEFYKSNVSTEVDIQYTSTSNTLSYAYLSTPAASSTDWASVSSTFTTPANVKSLTIFHVIDKVGWLQTDDFSLSDNTTVTPTAPTVSITAPAPNATVSGNQNISANASDSLGITGVQFKVDNTILGSEDTASPYATTLDTTTLANGSHTIYATARNTSGLTTTVSETINVQNTVTPPSAPTVSFSAPAPNATVSGSLNISANAADNSGIAGVQFKLDGTNLGAEDTTTPYSVNWDTTGATNGNHTLSATARNISGLTTTVSETVNVQNTVTPPSNNGPNLIANPSFETASGSLPASWLTSAWGTNTSAFSYLNTGHTGSRSVEVQTTAYSNGAASWYYNDIPITAGQTYQYTNWYKSNVDTEVDAEVVMTNGTVNYYWLGNVLASTAWTKFSTTFTPPTGAKTMAIYQILAKTGYIISDDYSLNTYAAVPFNRALVSVTFDDGWANQYQNAYPLLAQYGIPATFYIISGELTDQPDYMTGAQIKTLQGAGNEIGSHSVTHPDLTTLSQTSMVNELSQSQTTLQNLLGVPVTDFAYPYGAYNANTISVGKQYYQSQRTVNAGYNTRDNFDLTQLKIYEVDGNISQAQVKGWIDGAIAQKAWLILVYHETANTPVDPSDSLYTTKPSDLNAELQYLKTTGVATITVNQAINEILTQL